MIGKVFFPEGWICNPHTPVQSKHTFSFSLCSGPRLPKRSQKASQNGASGHPNSQKKTENQTLKKTLKNECKKYQKKLQKRGRDSWRRGHQNHKNPSLGLKMCPKPPGRVPRHPKCSKSSKNEPPGPPKSFKIIRIW